MSLAKAAVRPFPLRVVESQPFYREEVSTWAEEGEGEPHSLHSAIQFQENMSPEVAGHVIQRFSRRGEVVLDPFAGSGVALLEAALRGRVAFGADIDPLSQLVTRAKLEPADIAEVTLYLQRVNLRRPISSDLYRTGFNAFYDIDSFREIFNLRSALSPALSPALSGASDRVSRFVQVIAMSLLHGYSAGYFSVYSYPQLSVSVEEQNAINDRRRQNPDFRAVLPRILRKTAAVMRDGCPSVLELLEQKNRFKLVDSRDLNFVQSGEVSLLVSSPPVPGGGNFSSRQWMRRWFAELGAEPKRQLFDTGDLDLWSDFMNEVLLEGARVVKSGGRAALELRDIKVGREVVGLDEELISLVRKHLARYWDVECVLAHSTRDRRLKNCLKEREPLGSDEANKVLVLRRR